MRTPIWDDDDPYYDPELDEIEEDDDDRYERLQIRMGECTCGAYQYSDTRKEYVQVADCIC